MSEAAAHRRANEAQVELLRAELAKQAPPRPARPAVPAVIGWETGCVLALVVYVLLHLPLLPLVVGGAGLIAVDAFLRQQGWRVRFRWVVSLMVGGVLYLALWRS